jgi:hypothetical protein
MMWALANGYAPMLLWPQHAGWLILLIFLVPIWETLYFYLIHRLIHWPPLYRRVHYLHHRNINVGPWSGLSMHPVEHIIYLGSVLIHWVVPSNPLLIIYHLQHYTLSAATTPCLPQLRIAEMKESRLVARYGLRSGLFITRCIIAISNVTMVVWKYPAINGPDRLTMARPSRIRYFCKNEN